MDLSNEQKFEILKEAYIEQRKEINFWRDRSWKVTTWTVATLLAVLAVIIKYEITYMVQILIPIAALSGVVTIYLNKNYNVYCERWERLAEVEEALGFFCKGVFIQDKSLLPEHLRKPKVTYKGTGFFIAAIWIIYISIAIIALCKYCRQI